MLLTCQRALIGEPAVLNCVGCLDPVILASVVDLFILNRQVYFTHMCCEYLYCVLLSECVQSVSSAASGVPRELCAHDVLQKTHIHARLHV